MASEVLIVATGVANLASVRAALRRLDIRSRTSASPEGIRAAERLVLPGVGAFGSAMAQLDERGLTEALIERLRERRPTLAICLGMQLLCNTSEESPEARGLGVLDGGVTRFPAGVRCPQFGWNRVEAPAGARYLRSGYAYFANSYCLRSAPEGWRAAQTDHGGPFVSAVESGDVVACQFHPELSARYGAELLARWCLQRSSQGAGSC
ncbi:MAG: imidazole glycerol phosphate synthase subunit HisH [Proteobacteria bacterium]|nr:imidazole glycerol phosphate synthase subunit HisH [Pseudomonadota bacterium]